MIKPIYRVAIVGKTMEVLYMSSLLYNDRDIAIKEAKKLPYKKEEEINRHRWQDICFKIVNRDTWRTFEIIINDSNKKYIGIVRETLVLD